MTPTNDGDTLRALIRLLPPARRMREDLERMTQTEAYDGIGDVTLRSFQGLVESLAQISADPFVNGLILHLPDGATDKQKVWQAFLASGQVVAYLEAQTGFGSGSGAAVRSGPSMHIGELHLPSVKQIPSLHRIVGSALNDEEGSEGG